MKRKALLILFAVTFIVHSLFAETGKEIMEKSNKLRKSNNSKSMAEMKIYKAGDVINRKIKMVTFKKGTIEKGLLEILEPFKMKVLTHSYKGKEDQQWLKQKNGKVKKIISGDRKKPFVNSHIFYEDIRARDINDYSYKLICK